MSEQGMVQATTADAEAPIDHPGTEGAAAINLLKFCGKDDFRPYLQTPFRFNGFVYASDGRILLRVQDDPKFEARKNINPEKVIEPALSATYLTAPAVNIPPKAAPEVVKCGACDGRGHEHDCPDCDCECDACDGSGELYSNPLVSTDFGCQIFDVDYLRLIYSLPDLEIAPSSESAMLNALYFRFKGGVGAVMPCARPHEKHINIQTTSDAA